MSSDLIGASVWESELYAHLNAHAENEMALLAPYEEAARESPSAAFRYLASLIVEDERRHHRHFADLAASLRSEAEMSPEAPVVPRLDLADVPSEELRSLTRRLIEEERADLKELKRLEHDLDDVRDTTLWGLLVELMELDTEKHLKILRFVEKHLAA